MLKQLRKLQKDSQGFTLVELMIVVAIIGILAAIAIPNFLAYQLRSKRAELPTNLQAIKTSQESYRAEFNAYQTLVASPALALTTGKRPWVDAGGFASIGWVASGPVFGQYSTTAATATTWTGLAESNLDGNNTNAQYGVTEVSNVSMTSANDVY